MKKSSMAWVAAASILAAAWAAGCGSSTDDGTGGGGAAGSGGEAGSGGSAGSAGSTDDSGTDAMDTDATDMDAMGDAAMSCSDFSSGGSCQTCLYTQCQTDLCACLADATCGGAIYDYIVCIGGDGGDPTACEDAFAGANNGASIDLANSLVGCLKTAPTDDAGADAGASCETTCYAH